jgi:hypothetical protein
MNYREQTETGTTWRRCHEVHIANPIEGKKWVRMDEEDVVSVAGKTITAYANYISADFDPAGTVPLRDPETGDLTGQHMTHMALYQALYSLYIQTAMARDAEEQSNA